MKKDIKETEAILKDLNGKFNEANKLIDRLEEEHNELKSQVE